MDDLPVFENFLSTQCGLTVNISREEKFGSVNSFTALYATSDVDINDFAKSMHTKNSASPANEKIMIPASAIIALKALLFELEDRARCGALSVLATLQALEAVKLNYIHVQREKSVAYKAKFSALSKLPEIKATKLTADNYEIFTTDFYYIMGRTIGMDGIPIYYVMLGVTGNSDYPWTNWQDKLNNCLSHSSDYFNNDNITLYLLYSQYIGTKGVDSNIINKYHSTKNVRKCHQDFELHFRNDDYLTKKATAATITMNSSVYNSDCRNFTLDNYYTIMSKTCNDSHATTSAHALNNKRK